MQEALLPMAQMFQQLFEDEYTTSIHIHSTQYSTCWKVKATGFDHIVWSLVTCSKKQLSLDQKMIKK